MPKYPKAYRFLALALTGGCLLQLVGCAGGIIPVALSFLESSFLRALFTGAGSP